MADKKYQVFISSTYADLKEERRKILDILLMADCIPSGMEAFVATDNEQFEVIKKVIDLCDYYVLIIGRRYGSVSSLTGKSYTEMEYDYAKSIGIPVLVFAIDESVELPERKIESDPSKIKLLKQFREKTMSNRLVSIWKTDVELTSMLAVSIMRAITEIARPGWIRAQKNKNELSNITDDHLESKNTMEYSGVGTDLQMQFYNRKFWISHDTSININYFYDHHFNNHRYSEMRVLKMSDIFTLIANEVGESSFSITRIKLLFEQKLLESGFYKYFIEDIKQIANILTQLSKLGLIQLTHGNSSSMQLWKLTQKGIDISK